MIRLLMIISLVLLVSAAGVFAQGEGIVFDPIPSPTMIPSSTPMMHATSVMPSGPIYQFLSTAAANINSLPDQISRPGGISLVPAVDGRQLFGYAKWLFSGSSAQETLGRNFAPFAVHAFAAFTLIVFLVSVYLIITVATFLLRGVIWLVNQIRRLLPI